MKLFHSPASALILLTGMLSLSAGLNASGSDSTGGASAKTIPATTSDSNTVHSFKLAQGDVVALVGGANIERTRFNGFLQTHLIASQPELHITVRNFGWEGDTVFEQWRDGGALGNFDPSKSWRQQRDWSEQLSAVGATAVLVQFGQMESLNGLQQLPAFVSEYEKLVRRFVESGRKVVLISPLPFQKTSQKLAPDLTKHNESVYAYAEAIRVLANQLGVTYVDLTGLRSHAESLADNGYQLNERGHRVVADHIAKSLGISIKSYGETEGARRHILEMERLWFDYWRPMNWAFLSGDRTEVAYSKDWKDPTKRIFPDEMKEFEPLLRQADQNIWSVLTGGRPSPISTRSPIPNEPPSLKPESPEEEMAAFKVLDGFSVNLFASEADGVVKPIQMRWDERGRLWIACAPSYPQIKPGERANDYVLVCEDTDGDGRADKFTKFVEGLFMPTGIELGDGGLYVAQGTELLHFKDTDGDGRADASRIVLGGFGTADSHQMINCLNWGFGGELWFTQGHHIYSRVETPYGVETLNRSGVWRWRPRTARLDPFFQWSSAGANCWGVVTTKYGQPFHKSGANVGAYYSTPGLVRSTLGVNSQSMNLFTANAKQVGMEIIGSSHFPREMQGRVVIGGYYANCLEQYDLRLEDGVFVSSPLPNIIQTRNNTFRPVEVRTGPDGAIYVADWYNPIIGHYQASYRHPDRDKEHGRIWRVSYKGAPLVKAASLANAVTAGLLEQLDSPERWTANQAKRLLFERDTTEVTAALDAWVPKLSSEDEAGEYRRLQALSLYEAHETPRPALLKSLLRSNNPQIRAYATRTLSTWARDGRIPGALELLELQISDDDPIVRLEAIVAASYMTESKAAVIAARALDKPFNAYHQHALTKTLNATMPIWGPLLTADQFNFEKDEHLIFALQNSWAENGVAPSASVGSEPNKVQSGRPPSGNELPSPSLIMRRRVERFENDPARQKLWLRSLAVLATAADLQFIFERGAEEPAVLAALASSPSLRRSRPKEAVQMIEPLFKSSNVALRNQAVRLAGVWRLRDFLEPIRMTALDTKRSEDERKSALTALGGYGDAATPALLSVIGGTESAVLKAAALEAFVLGTPDAAARHALGKMKGVTQKEDALSLLRSMLARAEGRDAFVKVLSSTEALPRGSARVVLDAVNQLGLNDRKLSQVLMNLAGLNAALPAYTKSFVAALARAAETIGDAGEGRKIFERTGCVGCHMPGASQSKIGPDLSTISRGMPIDMIIAEVIWPALNVKEGYEAVAVTMKDGTILSGFKQTETSDTVGVRDMASGKVTSIRRSDTTKIQTGGSLMPDGLTADLTEQEMAHLFRYLSELGK